MGAMQILWRRPLFLIPLIVMLSLLASALVLILFILADSSLTLAEWYSQPGLMIDTWIAQHVAGYENSLEHFGGEHFLWGFPALMAIVAWAAVICLVVGLPFYRVVARKHSRAL
jgi:hypothetical protein